MKRLRPISVLATLLLSLSLWGQAGRDSVQISYAAPKRYIVAGIDCEGVTYFSKSQVLLTVTPAAK